MKSFVPVVLCCSCLLTGCSILSHFGYYKYEKPERAPPGEVQEVRFPDSFEKGVHLAGPMMMAVKVAMDDFLPPGVKVEGDDERINQCLSHWATFDTSVLQAGDDLYFVSFVPRLSRCGINERVLDAGATYAIDGKGRILDIQ